MPSFERYIGIDYSGAATADSSLSGLRVYVADRPGEPVEVLPPPSRRRHWTRRGLAQWLIDRFAEQQPTLVGIDHGFSFPLAYFEAHALAGNWPAFLDDFQCHWPTDATGVTAEMVREGVAGRGRERSGHARWRRLTEQRTKRAKSVFHFDVQGAVAKSTHTGLPWLRAIRQSQPLVHFWPFDGWDVAAGRSAVAEVYPSLWSADFERGNRSADQHDAYTIAAWLARADRDGSLAAAFRPELSEAERSTAALEGWILGVQ